MQSQTVTTAEQLLALREPGWRHELVHGELRRMSPAGYWHGAVVGRMTALLGRRVRDHGLGVMFGAKTGFVLARDPDTVRAPDVAFVVRNRMLEPGPGYFPGPPDLAVEVTSPGDTFTSVNEKALSWLAHGTGLVWVVDPMARRVTVYHSSDDIHTLGLDDTLCGGDLVPGFTVRVRELFDA